MPIQVSTQSAQISWDVQRAKLEQSGNGVKTLQLSTTKPSLEMQTELPKIQIDQSACFEEAGRMGIKAFMDDAVSYGQQILSSSIARTVDQGNELSNIQNRYDPIPDQALANAYDIFDKEFNYGAIPQSRPSISLSKGSVTTNFNPGEVNNSTPAQKVEFTYSPWKIDYYMKQYSSINFRYEPSTLKLSV